MHKIRNDRTFCCVPQCNSQGTRNTDISFHQFPPDTSKISVKSINGNKVLMSRKKEWLRLLKIGKKVSKRAKVCSKHFVPGDYITPANISQRPRLRPTAVPSCFLPVVSQNDSVSKQHNTERQARYEKLNRNKDTNVDCETGEEIGEEVQEDVSANNDDENDNDLRSTVNMEMLAVEGLLEISNCTSNTTDKEIQVVSGDLKLPYIINSSELSDRQLRAITGIPSMGIFNCLSETVNAELKTSNKHKLPLKERIILVFMKIKLNLTFECLSIFFGICERTASNIFSTLVPVISSILESVIEFVPKEEISANLSKYFRGFTDVRIVLDCTEIYIHKPRCLTERISTYSTYYGDQTLKYMIGTSPGGLITFVSKGYGGRTPDRHIFEESKLIEMLEPFTDSIMVDKGFLIDDICEENFIKLIRPPFLRQKKQLSSSEALMCQKIAQARVHVERSIGRLKHFALINTTVPHHMNHLIDQIMIIIAGIVNLSSPIHGDDKF